MKAIISSLFAVQKFKVKRFYVKAFFIVAIFLPSNIFAQEAPDSVKVAQSKIDDYNATKKAAKQEAVTSVTEQDGTGNDPRAFANKWTPNYRYTELDNGLKVQDINLSGTIAFTRNLGVIYELPAAKLMDLSEVEGLPEGTPKSVIGMGDVSLKFLANLRSLDFFYGEGKKKSGTFVVGTDFVLPTATNEMLAGNSFKIAPIVGVVVDMPAYGFFAFLNLYYFDVFKSEAAPTTSMYVGRWFYMQPLTPPGKWWGLFFLMPEFQPVYDFEADEFSFWIGVELGKIISEGNVAYVKPGWGIDNNNPAMTDRSFSFEAGWRYFF